MTFIIEWGVSKSERIPIFFYKWHSGWWVICICYANIIKIMETEIWKGATYKIKK